MTEHAGPIARRRAAFTLIEVLIVVMIVAIVAGVVISRVGSQVNDAKDASVHHSLRTMQTLIQLYRVDHLGRLPKISNQSLPQLYSATNEAGEIGVPGSKFPHGPYVDVIPRNPFDSSDAVTAVAAPGIRPTGVVGARGGWQFDEMTGMVWPNHAEFYQIAP